MYSKGVCALGTLAIRKWTFTGMVKDWTGQSCGYIVQLRAEKSQNEGENTVDVNTARLV